MNPAIVPAWKEDFLQFFCRKIPRRPNTGINFLLCNKARNKINFVQTDEILSS